MDKLITALGPVFAAGFAIQQLLELLSPLLDKISGDNKKLVSSGISLAAGLILAFSVRALRVLNPLLTASGEPPAMFPDVIDQCVTALVLSAGTEGLNSILKFMKYSKEDKKNSAAAKDPSNAGGAAAAVAAHALMPPGMPTKAALDKMNQK